MGSFFLAVFISIQFLITSSLSSEDHRSSVHFHSNGHHYHLANDHGGHFHQGVHWNHWDKGHLSWDHYWGPHYGPHWFHHWHHWYWKGGGLWGNYPGYYYDPNFYWSATTIPAMPFLEVEFQKIPHPSAATDKINLFEPNAQ